MTTEEQVRSILKDKLLKKGQDITHIKSKDSLVTSGIIDSLGLLILVDEVEKIFELKVDPEEYSLDTFGSIEAICKFIDSKN